MPETILLIARHWPEPASTAAGRRTLDLLQIFAEQGARIHLASPADASPFQADMTELGYTCHSIRLNHDSFNEWLATLKPDLVIFDRFVSEEQFGWRVRETLPDAITLLDTSDLHCLRSAREQEVKKQVPFNLFNDIALREIAALVRCDLTIMISEVEIDLLHRHFGIPEILLAYLPFLVDKQDIRTGAEFGERKHLIMMGGFKHEPNRDATRWLRSEIWPAARRVLPKGVEMHVYGAYADHAMMQLHQPKEGFYVKGRAEDALQTFQQYRLNLAPLRFGAGQKGKILEGWLSGTPTISNAIGMESMTGQCPLGYELPNTADEFAAVITRAYNDQELWQTIADRGRHIVQSRFNRLEHSQRLIEQVAAIASDLHAHRTLNFWGRMLWQQQFRAQEFMSRWIESKTELNKNRGD